MGPTWGAFCQITLTSCCCIICVTEQWAFTVIKLLPGFSFSCTTWHGLTQVLSNLCMCSISAPHKTRMFTVRLAGNGHGFEVAVLALAMPLDHPNVAATVLRICLNSGAQKAILNFKKLSLVKWLSLDFKFVVVYKVSSKLVHALTASRRP